MSPKNEVVLLDQSVMDLVHMSNSRVGKTSSDLNDLTTMFHLFLEHAA